VCVHLYIINSFLYSKNRLVTFKKGGLFVQVGGLFRILRGKKSFLFFYLFINQYFKKYCPHSFHNVADFFMVGIDCISKRVAVDYAGLCGSADRWGWYKDKNIPQNS